MVKNKNTVFYAHSFNYHQNQDDSHIYKTSPDLFSQFQVLCKTS